MRGELERVPWSVLREAAVRAEAAKRAERAAERATERERAVKVLGWTPGELAQAELAVQACRRGRR